MHQIILNVTDEQLANMVKSLKEYEPEYKVLNACKVLELLLKNEIEHADVYIVEKIDNGGNALIGDVLDEKDCVGVVEEIES
jgi:hypothetical protein